MKQKFRRPVVQAVKMYRSMTESIRVLPDFIIIGARKCGTTSLYEYLTQHPCVRPALTKELFFFDYHYEKGTNWYQRHFPTRYEMWVYKKAYGQSVITGEATPSYFYHPEVAWRIAQLLPQVKLILLLREPVEAAYSAYQFGLKMGTYTDKEVIFQQVIQAELEYLQQGGTLFHQVNGTLAINPQCSLLARHVYIELLGPWFEIFDRHQIKVILSEDLFAHPAKICAEVHEFLGLPAHEITSYERFNKNTYPELSADLAEPIEKFYAPFNQRLGEFLGRSLNWRFSERRNGMLGTPLQIFI